VIELTTDRLLIREIHVSDSEAFCRFMQTEHYWRHSPIDPPTAESVATLMRRLLEIRTEDPRSEYRLAAVDKQSEEFIGEACLHIFMPWRSGEIGWGVVESRIGQGIATEMCHALLRFAFDALDLHRVQARCRSENHASRRIMAKLGMREEGVMRDNIFVRGEWWSTVQAAILSTDPEQSPRLHEYSHLVTGGS